jgi:glycopeptide antibiotics resistance protein
MFTLAFAVEIGQAVTHTGSMEIADIAMGMWGVLAFGAVYTLVHYFRKALRKRKGETR